jgi:hypothetical protein
MNRATKERGIEFATPKGITTEGSNPSLRQKTNAHCEAQLALFFTTEQAG